MALHTKKQFASSCGMSTAQLSVYIGRMKVIVRGDDYIDDEVEQNKSFRKIRLDKLALKNPDGIPEPEIKKPGKSKPPELNFEDPDEKAQKKKEFDDSSRDHHKLIKEKTAESTEKTRIETDILRLKREKMSGDVIPTAVTKVLFQNTIRSFVTSFKEAAENFLSHIAKSKGLSRNEMADARGELIKVINDASRSAVVSSDAGIAHIVSEYSQSKTIGERE